MILAPAQYAALKAHILANTNTIDWNAAQVPINTLPPTVAASFEIVKWYNLPTAPAFWVWRTTVTKAEATQNTSRTGTSFTWNGTGFITRTIQELMAWNELFFEGVCNPSLPNVRQAFADIFSGPGNALANRTHLDIVARRPATNIERIYATGAGGDTAATAGTLVFLSPLSYQDLDEARNS